MPFFNSSNHIKVGYIHHNVEHALGFRYSKRIDQFVDGTDPGTHCYTTSDDQVHSVGVHLKIHDYLLVGPHHNIIKKLVEWHYNNCTIKAVGLSMCGHWVSHNHTHYQMPHSSHRPTVKIIVRGGKGFDNLYNAIGSVFMRGFINELTGFDVLGGAGDTVEYFDKLRTKMQPAVRRLLRHSIKRFETDFHARNMLLQHLLKIKFSGKPMRVELTNHVSNFYQMSDHVRVIDTGKTEITAFELLYILYVQDIFKDLVKEDHVDAGYHSRHGSKTSSASSDTLSDSGIGGSIPASPGLPPVMPAPSSIYRDADGIDYATV